MKRKSRITPALAVMLALVGASACDEEEIDGPTPTISIAASPTALSVEQGQSGTATVTLTRGGDFDGPVALAVTGAPSGVTVTATPSSLTGATTTAQIAVNVGASTAAGNHTLTVTASGTGVSNATATITLTVTAAPVGMYTLSVTPAAASVAQGGSVNVTVDLTRTAFTGDVTLAATGLPAGVTAAFDPATVSGNTSTLTLTAAANASVGAATVTITGTAAGLADVTAQLGLTVTETSSGGNVTWTFCPASGEPVWVAYKDGDDAWVRATEAADNTYTMQFDENRGAVAFATDDDGDAAVSVFYGLQSELVLQGENLCGGTGVTKTVMGTFAGLAATDQAFVTLGGSTATLLPSTGTNFTLEDVLDGPRDLIAARASFDISGGDITTEIDRLIFRRGINPADGATLPVLDFEGDEAFEPVINDVTVDGADGDPTFVLTAYFTENGAASTFFTGLPDAGETMMYAGVPADQQEPTDLHLLSVTALNDLSDPSQTRTVQEMFLEATDRTLTLGPDLTAVMVSEIDGAPYVRLRAQYTPQAEYDDFWLVAFAQPERLWLLSATRGYIGAGNDVDLAIPDFSGTDGWDPDAWALEAGVQTDWFFSASGWTEEGGVVTTPFEEGAVLTSATRFGTITP